MAGSGWGNSFSLLDEDESGEGAVRVPVKVAAPAATKPVKEEPKTAHKNAAVTDNKESGRKPERQQRAPRAREERGPREESAEQQQQQGGAVSTSNNDRGFNRTRGPSDRNSGERRERRDNGASGAPGAARAPRQFDRRSGTGRGREVQRGGAGRGNWGSDEQEIQEQVKAVDHGDASVDNAATGAGSHDADWAAKNDDSWGAAAPSTAATDADAGGAAKEEKAPRELSEDEKARQAEREAEAKLMTLDEYLQNKKKLDYQLPAPRQAGEGEDSKQWAGFVAAKSDKAADAASSPLGSKKADESKKATKEQKKVPLPAELLRFKGEQQRRDSERRERPRDGGFERRERRDDQPARAPRANNNNNNSGNKQAKQAEFAPQDFPSLKA